MTFRECSLYVGHVNGRTLMRITGEIDLSNAARLEDTLALVTGPIIVDCSRLEFIDVAGLEVLARAAEAHGGMILRNPSPSVSRLVYIAKVDHLFVLDPPAVGDDEIPPTRLAS